MKTKLLSTLFLCLATVCLQAQVDIKWNEAYSSAFTNRVVDEDFQAIYTLSSDKTSLYIEQYNKENLALIKQTPFQVPITETATLEHFCGYQGKITLFYSIYSKTDKKISLFAYQIDKNAQIITKPKEVFSKKIPKRFMEENFKIKTHPEDSSYYFIYHMDLQKTSLDFVFVDGELDVLDVGNKDLSIEYEDPLYYFLECFTDKNFNIYIQSKTRYSEYGKLYKSTLSKLSFNKEGQLEDKEEYSWAIEEKSVDDLLIHFGQGDDMIVAAIRKGWRTPAGSTEKQFSVLGLSWTKINTLSGKKISEQYSAFNQEQLKAFLTEEEWEKSRDPDQFGDLVPLQIVSGKKEGYYLVCEDRNQYFSSDGVSYKFMSLIICNIDKEGKVSWLSCIPKNQGFPGSYLPRNIDVYKESKMEISVGFLAISGYIDYRPYLSYTLFQEDGKLYFIFNDGIGNFKGKGEMNYVQFGFSFGMPTYAIVDKEGRVSKNLIYPKMRKDLKMRAGITYKMNSGDIIIFSGKGKFNKLGKIKL